MHVRLPSRSDDGDFVPLEDEYSMAELEKRAAVYLRRRFALSCDHERAGARRAERASDASHSAMSLRHGDVAVIGHGIRESTENGVTTRTSEVHVAVSLDAERLAQLSHETGTVTGR